MIKGIQRKIHAVIPGKRRAAHHGGRVISPMALNMDPALNSVIIFSVTREIKCNAGMRRQRYRDRYTKG